MGQVGMEDEEEAEMAARCTHLNQIREVTPGADGCEDCLRVGRPMGSPSSVHGVWSRRVLRQFPQQACD